MTASPSTTPGFYNIGARPTQNDEGLGVTDAFGNQLSYARQFVNGQSFDNVKIDPCSSRILHRRAMWLPAIRPLTQRVACRWRNEGPGLRKHRPDPAVLHNGGQGTLAQVVHSTAAAATADTPGGDTTGTGTLGEDTPS